MSWSARVTPTHHARVPSGLQVLAVDRPGLPFAVVLSQLRGGSRIDPPVAAGMAHLTEHLLAQGTAPDGDRWAAPVLALGGDINATTHPDHLEFCTEVPYAGLAHALAAERARLSGWPRLRPGVLDRQRDGVCREIEQHLRRPTRSLPWPALGVPVFGSWAEGHDPFGEVEHVRVLTEADCRRFSERHHRPERAVVVVVADLSRVPGGFAGLTAALDVPTREPAPPPDTPVASPPGEPGLRAAPGWSAPHSVGALAWRVPSVVDRPGAYAGLLALAAHLARRPRARGRVGQMTPMDRLDADALTLTVVDAHDARPALEEALVEVTVLARGGGQDADLREAVARAQTATATLLDRPRGAAQLVARAALLAHDPHAAGEWVEAVAGLGPDDVRAAARLLDETPPVGLVGRPDPPTRPVLHAEPARPARRPGPSCTPSRPVLHTEPADRARPVRLLGLARDTLTAAVAVRLEAPPGSGLVSRLRAAGHQVSRDAAGWVLTCAAYAPADALAARVRADLGEAAVHHAVAVGRRADRVAPWAAPVPRAPEPAGERAAYDLLGADGLPPGTATAELAWPTAPGGFVARWLGLALLVGIQRRDGDGDVHPFDAPPDLFLSARQEAVPGERLLVVEAYAAPDRLPLALAHLARELEPDRLRARTAEAPRAAASLVAGWERDSHDPAALARRALAMLDLGASDADVREFGARLAATSGDAVADRLLADTARPPRLVVRTSRPDLVAPETLPRRWREPGTRG